MSIFPRHPSVQTPVQDLPVGTILPFAGVLLPTNWLWCDASPIDAVKYPLLAKLSFPYSEVPTYNGTGRFQFGASDATEVIGASGTMGHFNYSVTLTQQNIPHLDLTYGGSSWSASLKATGVTMGNMVQATSDNDNYINYYSTSGAHTSSEVTFDALNDFTTSYTGQNLPITGTTQTLTTMVLPSIAIKYIIKAQ